MAAVDTDPVLPAHFLADVAAQQVKPPPPTPGESVDAGFDDAPRSPAKPRPAKPQKPAMVNGTGAPDGVVYEKVNGTNGTSLTSLKPPDDYEEALALDELERKGRNSGRQQLVSGRQPSAGWERSGCVRLLR
jgi:hypothetical protein